MDTKDGAFGRKQQNSKQLDPGAEYSNIIEARKDFTPYREINWKFLSFFLSYLMVSQMKVPSW